MATHTPPQVVSTKIFLIVVHNYDYILAETI